MAFAIQVKVWFAKKSLKHSLIKKCNLLLASKGLQCRVIILIYYVI